MIVQSCSRKGQTMFKTCVSNQHSLLFSKLLTSFSPSISLIKPTTRKQPIALFRTQLPTSVNKRTFSTSGSPPPLGKGSKQSAVPFMGISFMACAAVAAAAYLYSDYKTKEIAEERKKKQEELQKERKVKGKALIGGPFTLVNTEGDTVTDKNFLGKWILVYFGFTFCPDICPEELEKIGEIVDLLDKTPEAPKIQPVFISVDPKRDTPELIKSYLEDFHPKFIGLTGTKEQVKRATKAYRVYFSEGPDQAEGANEYIVDHSIVTFLVDPKGDFAANFGQRTSPEEAVGKIVIKMNDFYEVDS